MITGATSGIGKATAEVLANTHRLIICGRRLERLEELRSNLHSQTDVVTLNFDVSIQADVHSAIQSLPTEWVNIDVLVNNAGNAHGLAPIHAGDLKDWEAMIDINLKGLLYVTHEVLPNMIERKTGHIINVGSIAGIEAYKNGNVYNASKYAVDGLTKSMRHDLTEHNIKVSEIKPGAVNTEFSEVRFKGDKARADKVYEGFLPLSGQDVAEAIAFIVNSPYHVNIADLLILPRAQSGATTVHKNK